MSHLATIARQINGLLADNKAALSYELISAHQYIPETVETFFLELTKLLTNLTQLKLRTLDSTQKQMLLAAFKLFSAMPSCPGPLQTNITKFRFLYALNDVITAPIPEPLEIGLLDSCGPNFFDLTVEERFVRLNQLGSQPKFVSLLTQHANHAAVNFFVLEAIDHELELAEQLNGSIARFAEMPLLDIPAPIKNKLTEIIDEYISSRVGTPHKSNYGAGDLTAVSKHLRCNQLTLAKVNLALEFKYLVSSLVSYPDVLLFNGHAAAENTFIEGQHNYKTIGRSGLILMMERIQNIAEHDALTARQQPPSLRT